MSAAKVHGIIEQYFQIPVRGSTIWKEIVGGTTTFLTVCYILVVNPKVLNVAGIPIKDGGTVMKLAPCCIHYFLQRYAFCYADD